MQRKRGSAESVRLETCDPLGCPFREFRDTELGPDLWGLGPKAVFVKHSKTTVSGKSPVLDHIWEDDQVQPLPPSVRNSLDGWIRAELLAGNWNAALVVAREALGSEVNTMRSREVQMIYSEVLKRSSFCRKVLSCCYILERVDNFVVQHQWENFTCATGPEGWLARLHILSPGMKPGGGSQHKPPLSKNGCYLVRLYYLGAWRCVWVNDLVPVDSHQAPLLPFAPTLPTSPQPVPKSPKVQPVVQQVVVQLWPLLICKALLKLAAIEMAEESSHYEDDDDVFDDFDVMHCLTGALSIVHDFVVQSVDTTWLWDFMNKEIEVFSWEESAKDPNPVRGKNPKKPETSRQFSRKSIVSLTIEDTLGLPSYELPGLSPAYEMYLLMMMVRDLPLVKPPDEPEVPLWKTYRWVDWARRHGLYDDYECPRKKWIKAMGLLRLSRAPHLLDVRSTESISTATAKEMDKNKKLSDTTTKKSTMSFIPGQTKESMEWIDFERLCKYVTQVNASYLPSTHEFYSAGSAPCTRIPTRTVQTKITELQAPTNAPLYLQVDSEETITFYISLSTIHPNVLVNCGANLKQYVRPSHIVLEKFDWLADVNILATKVAYLETRRYASLPVIVSPGRHIFRLWVNSPLTWHFSVLTQASLNLCKRSSAMGLAVHETSWAANKLAVIGLSLTNWLKALPERSLSLGRVFYASYAPDLVWKKEEVGYPRVHIHEMFRRALQKFLQSRLSPADFDIACATLRDVFLDPYLGLPEPAEPFHFKEYLDSCLRCKCFLNESTPSDYAEEEILSKSESNESKSQHLISLGIDNVQDSFKFIESIECSDICTDGLINPEYFTAVINNIRAKNNAAIKIQKNWRRVRCRRMLNGSGISQDALKTILEQISSPTGMSLIMSTFFKLYPGASSAYALSSGIGGRYDHQQYSGVTTTTSRDIWIPLFITTFYCHTPVRVHFDIECSLRKKTVVILNNDSMIEVPVVLSSELCYDFLPNVKGYDVHAHAWKTSSGIYKVEDISWTLTLLASEQRAFHVCDNGIPTCESVDPTEAYKLRLDEMFIPNKRNILAGMRLFVNMPTTVSVCAKSNYPELNIEVIIREKDSPEEVARCSGRGQLFWSPVGLEGQPLTFSRTDIGQISYKHDKGSGSSRTMKKKPPSSASSKKSVKVAKTSQSLLGPEAKVYEIELVATEGWPLTTDQWIRVDEVWNPPESVQVGSVTAKKPKDVIDEFQRNIPQESDASCVLEVSVSPENEVYIERYNKLELTWTALVNSWERGRRHALGAAFREEFRNKYLLVPLSDNESATSFSEITTEKTESLKSHEKSKSQSVLMEPIEDRYITKPPHLQENFRSFEFASTCIKEELPDKLVLTPEAAEDAHELLLEKIEEANRRMYELQEYNVEQVLGAQRRRNRLVENKLFVDGGYRTGLAIALDMRDEAARVGPTPPRNLSVQSVKKGKKK